MSISIKDNGFSITLETGLKEIAWDDIKEIVAYKADLMTYDIICLEIVLSDSTIKITEEVDEWPEFLEEINKVYPSVDRDWYAKIMAPAFETNFTILYKK